MEITKIKDKAENISDEIKAISLILDNIEELEKNKNTIEIYEKYDSATGDLINLCIKELLSIADKVKTITEE